MKKSLKDKIKKIKVLILDVDGILTGGQIILNHLGEEIKVFDVQDGFGLVLWKKFGYRSAIISARAASAVVLRAKDLKIDKVFQDAYPKVHAYEEVLKEFNVKDEEVCFMGDDLPDLGVLRRVGLAVSVPNGVVEVKREVDYVTKSKGGAGAIREVIELIFKTQGNWDKICRQF